MCSRRSINSGSSPVSGRGSAGPKFPRRHGHAAHLRCSRPIGWPSGSGTELPPLILTRSRHDHTTVRVKASRAGCGSGWFGPHHEVGCGHQVPPLLALPPRRSGTAVSSLCNPAPPQPGGAGLLRRDCRAGKGKRVHRVEIAEKSANEDDAGASFRKGLKTGVLLGCLSLLGRCGSGRPDLYRCLR